MQERNVGCKSCPGKQRCDGSVSVETMPTWFILRTIAWVQFVQYTDTPKTWPSSLCEKCRGSSRNCIVILFFYLFSFCYSEGNMLNMAHGGAQVKIVVQVYGTVEQK